MPEGGRRAAGSGGTRADVLIVSLGSTGGLRVADDELAASLRRAGASVGMVRAARPREVRTLVLTDLAWARAARAAARAGIASARPRALLYSTTTAALWWPEPGAVRFDAPSAGNRPGRHGIWQRPLERRRLAQSGLLVPWSEQSLAECPAPHAEAVVLPVPVEPSAGRFEATGRRDVEVVAYGANPLKKGLDQVLTAWARVRRGDERLVVAGIGEGEVRRVLGREAAATPGADFAGVLAAPDYRALLRRAHVFVSAARREDYGIAQLEALADGCRLVTTPAPGPYAALPLARALDARLVSEEVGAAMRLALDEPHPGYGERALELLAPWRRAAADRQVAERLLPRLLELRR